MRTSLNLVLALTFSLTCSVGLGATAAHAQATPPAPPPAPGPEKKDGVPELIRKLGDASFETREAAQRELERIGRPALRALDEAAKSQAEQRREQNHERQNMPNFNCGRHQGVFLLTEGLDVQVFNNKAPGSYLSDERPSRGFSTELST